MDEPIDFFDEPLNGASAVPDRPRPKRPRNRGTRRLIIAVVITALVAGSIGYAIGRNSGQAVAGSEPTASASSAPTATTATTEPSEITPTGTTSPPSTTPDPGSQGTTSANSAQYYLDLLATLEIKGRAPKTGYDRLLFGEAWMDVDGNGCDTRNDILRRDLTDVVPRSGCIVETGLLRGPYTGTDIFFQRGSDTSVLVQIDHVVPLLDAWVKGAQQWTTAKRERFANDPRNLLAVDGTTNQQKGAGDAATWLPPNRSFWCEYAARIVVVKDAYGIATTSAEHERLGQILNNCDKSPDIDW